VDEYCFAFLERLPILCLMIKVEHSEVLLRPLHRRRFDFSRPIHEVYKDSERNRKLVNMIYSKQQSNPTPETRTNVIENERKARARASDRTTGVDNPCLASFKNLEYLAKRKKRRLRSRNMKVILTSENYSALSPLIPTYMSLKALPSRLPGKKYCDLTGFPAKYADPQSKLRYFSKDQFKLVRELKYDVAQGFLKIRDSEDVLR